jgi:hypothetical protein
MEREPALPPDIQENSLEASPERKDRFMELMEMRHRNAFSALAIERILSREEPSDEYPTTLLPENVKAKQEATVELESIISSMKNARYALKAEHLRLSIKDYFHKKINAQRTEHELKDQLKKKTLEGSPEDMGAELFLQKTGGKPQEKVTANRVEGYFILSFSTDEDYKKFVGEATLRDTIGEFHQSVRFPTLTTTDLVLIRYHLDDKTIEHERQHFINTSVFQEFFKIEADRVPVRKYPIIAEGYNQQESADAKVPLARVKDEVLARVRDGSNYIDATEFFQGISSYSDLKKLFTPEEQAEVELLLKEIGLQLKIILQKFPDMNRGLLVYHLIDIPLTKFPERIEALIRFGQEKIKEFKAKLPDSHSFRQTQKSNRQESEEQKTRKTKIALLYNAIIDNAISVRELIFPKEIKSYADQQTDLENVMAEIDKLRAEYDALLA